MNRENGRKICKIHVTVVHVFKLLGIMAQGHMGEWLYNSIILDLGIRWSGAKIFFT
jgi:hypothetical protein